MFDQVLFVREIIKKNYLNKYQKIFLAKHIVLNFSLLRATFLTIYKDITKLLSRQSKSKKHKALKKNNGRNTGNSVAS